MRPFLLATLLTIAMLAGDWTEEPSAEERAWMTAYSYCSQQVWGTWVATECPQVIETIVLVATTAGPT